MLILIIILKETKVADINTISQIISNMRKSIITGCLIFNHINFKINKILITILVLSISA